MIDNAPLDKNGKKINPFATYGKPEKGDLLYKDTNNDGIIDKDDRQIVSDGPNPKFFYGLNAGVTYKGIDFSTIFQGYRWSKGLLATRRLQYSNRTPWLSNATKRLPMGVGMKDEQMQHILAY